ncbi:MAG: CBS domain-containing protein [Nanoarchaeota archaeon]
MTLGITVEEVMTTTVLCAEPGVKLVDCAKLMAEKKVGSIVICTEKDRVIGILTEQDLVRKVMAKNIDPHSTLVTQIIPRKIITITPEKDLYEAMVLMQQHNIKHLPVVNKKGDLEGVISFKDVIRVEPGLIEINHFKEKLTEEQQHVVFPSEF